MSKMRVELVNKAFNKLDKNKDGKVLIKYNHYNSRYMNILN